MDKTESNPLKNLKRLKWDGKPLSLYRIAKLIEVSTNTVRAWDRGYYQPGEKNQGKLNELEARLMLESQVKGE